MRRDEFEHVIAAAAEVSKEDEFIVIGSQAILGSFPDPPPELLQSMEADVYPRNAPAKADLIDGMLGDGSMFHSTHGFYAHGVGPETAKLPLGWEERLVPVPVPPRFGSDRKPVAFCLEPHDLVLSKCAAGRDRDWDYARRALAAGVVDGDELVGRATLLPPELPERAWVIRQVEAVVQASRGA